MADGTFPMTVWFHPSMRLPVEIDTKANPFKIDPNMQVVDLMDECEEFFERESARLGTPLELQINVLWNIKDHKKALNPRDKLGLHFVANDTFGVYGDIQPRVEHLPPKPESEKVPVTILTGFLGSGKTTLLNYILQEQKEKKIAIIENEFGEISIDDALLKQDKLAMAEKVVVMDNGCMCCTIRGDLVNGLNEILDDIKAGGRIDAIMIETTGMADPVPIVRTFMTDPDLTSDLRLDAVITMADAKNLIGRLDDKVEEGKVNEAFQQIAFADKIILNKLDLIDTEQAIRTKDRIREVNRFAKVLPAVKGRVKMSELTDIHAHDMANFIHQEIEVAPKEEAMPAAAGHEGGHTGHGGHGDDCGEDHGHGDGGHGGDGHNEGHGGITLGHGVGAHGPGGHGHDQEGGHNSGGGGYPSDENAHAHGHDKAAMNRHDTRVNSFAIVKDGEILPHKLSAWMQSLGQLSQERGTIFRIKAILAVKNHPFKHVFHAVMDVSDEDDAAPWAEGEKKVSKIVFIGKSMDEAFLRKGFESIFE